jgi:hypothetical protein
MKEIEIKLNGKCRRRVKYNENKRKEKRNMTAKGQ